MSKYRTFLLVFFVFYQSFSSQALVDSECGSSQGQTLVPSVRSQSLHGLRLDPTVLKVSNLVSKIKSLQKHYPVLYPTINVSKRKYYGHHHMISKQIMTVLPSMMSKAQVAYFMMTLNIPYKTSLKKNKNDPIFYSKLLRIGVARYSLGLWLVHTPLNLIYPYGKIFDQKGRKKIVYVPSDRRADDPGEAFDFLSKYHPDGSFALTHHSRLLLGILLVIHEYLTHYETFLRTESIYSQGIFMSNPQFKKILSLFVQLKEKYNEKMPQFVAFRKVSKLQGKLPLLSRFVMDPRSSPVSKMGSGAEERKRKLYRMRLKKKPYRNSIRLF